MPKNNNRISGITVKGFKSIAAEQRLEIRPLTVLAGANSSGKSSFMQPLLLLKQTLDAPGDPPGALQLDGQNVRFTMAEQLFSHGSGKRSSNEFSVKIELSHGQFLELCFRQQQGKGVDVVNMVYADKEEKLSILPDMRHEDILAVLPKHILSFYQDLRKHEKGKYQWVVKQERCFLTFELQSMEEPRRIVSFLPFGGVSPGVIFVPEIQNIIHLPGLRGNPRRTYPRTSGGPEFPGTFEQYLASIITKWQTESDEKLVILGKNLEQMGLTWKVKADLIDDTQVELKVGRLSHSRQGGAHDLVSIADVGFGVSQSLPVVVALLVAHPGQLVYLEQPEIHLHPLAQRKLANILKDAVNRGVVAVVETHSALLLREIQTLVATNRLSRDNVVFHWLQRSEAGNTVSKTANLDENGAYGDWPEDFDQIELQAEQEYLDAVELQGSKA